MSLQESFEYQETLRANSQEDKYGRAMQASTFDLFYGLIMSSARQDLDSVHSYLYTHPAPLDILIYNCSIPSISRSSVLSS